MKFLWIIVPLRWMPLRGRWRDSCSGRLIASLLRANIVRSSDRVISNMSQNANGDTPGFAGLFSTGSGGVLAVSRDLHPCLGSVYTSSWAVRCGWATPGST